MFSIIFLHGALLGGWVWQDVSPVLEKKGHEVFTPDLPGRDGKSLNKIDLGTHLRAVSKIVESSTKPVVIVAHSMSGIIASQIAEMLHLKVKKVIYVSAYLPLSGQSLETLFTQHFGPLSYDKATMSIQLGKQLNTEDLIEASFHDCSEKFKQLVRENTVSEPIRPSLEKLKLTEKKYGSVSKSFIKLENDKVIPIKMQEKMLEAAGISEIYSMPTGHAPFCASPQKFTETLQKSMSKIK